MGGSGGTAFKAGCVRCGHGGLSRIDAARSGCMACRSAVRPWLRNLDVDDEKSASVPFAAFLGRPGLFESSFRKRKQTQTGRRASLPRKRRSHQRRAMARKQRCAQACARTRNDRSRKMPPFGHARSYAEGLGSERRLAARRPSHPSFRRTIKRSIRSSARSASRHPHALR